MSESEKYPATPDGRYFVVNGRLWRRTNPKLSASERKRLVGELMSARRAVRNAQNDETAMRDARARVHATKVALGERGPVWWTDGAEDFNRRKVDNTPYREWAKRQFPTTEDEYVNQIPIVSQTESPTMKPDPIIAVKDVNTSARWYRQLLGFERKHDGDEFAVLVDCDGNVVLCLHAWDVDDHPTLSDSQIPVGHGLILYFRLANLDTVHENARQMDWPVEETLHQNPNSRKTEFSLRDPDGYYLTFTELHHFEG